MFLFLSFRFGTIFSHDSDSMPRVWTGKEDLRAITKLARSAVWSAIPILCLVCKAWESLNTSLWFLVQSLKLLSVMAVLRLGDETDKIEKTLTVALLDATKNETSKKSITTSDPLASSTWDEVCVILFQCVWTLVILDLNRPHYFSRSHHQELWSHRSNVNLYGDSSRQKQSTQWLKPYLHRHDLLGSSLCLWIFDHYLKCLY